MIVAWREQEATRWGLVNDSANEETRKTGKREKKEEVEDKNGPTVSYLAKKKKKQNKTKQNVWEDKKPRPTRPNNKHMIKRKITYK